jgi:hypothetical protein
VGVKGITSCWGAVLAWRTHPPARQTADQSLLIEHNSRCEPADTDILAPKLAQLMSA